MTWMLTSTKSIILSSRSIVLSILTSRRQLVSNFKSIYVTLHSYSLKLMKSLVFFLSLTLGNADSFVKTSDELEYGRTVWVWLHFLGCICVLITIICGFLLTKSRSWIILAIFCLFYSWELFLLISYNTS